MNSLSPLDAARLLRRDQTPAEARLWSHVRRRQLDNLRFRRQHRFGKLIVDFYCRDVRLAVEVDGAVHDTDDQRAYDTDRDAALAALGVHVLRVTNANVFRQLDTVLQRIRDAATRARDNAPR